MRSSRVRDRRALKRGRSLRRTCAPKGTPRAGRHGPECARSPAASCDLPAAKLLLGTPMQNSAVQVLVTDVIAARLRLRAAVDRGKARQIPSAVRLDLSQR